MWMVAWLHVEEHEQELGVCLLEKMGEGVLIPARSSFSSSTGLVLARRSYYVTWESGFVERDIFQRQHMGHGQY